MPAWGRRGSRPRGGYLSPTPPRTDPPAAVWTAPGAHDRPATRVYPGGVRLKGRGAGPGATGRPPRRRRRGQRRPPPPIPPTPPRPGGHEGANPLPLPRPRGRPPSPGKDRDARKGDADGSAHRAPPRPPLPAPAAGGQTRTSAQDQGTGHTRGRRTTTNQRSMGAAPPRPGRRQCRPQCCPPWESRQRDRLR